MLASPLPAGVVTFLLTDAGRATRRLPKPRDAAERAVRAIAIVQQAVAARGGAWLADRDKDSSTVAVFTRASDAVASALDAQRELASESRTDGVPVRVRMALHTEEAEPRDATGYADAVIARGERLRALAPGGQVLISDATAAVMGDRLPAGASLLELDAVRPARGPSSEHAYLLCHPDLPEAGPGAFPRTETVGIPAWPTSLINRERERRDLAEILATTHLLTITGAGGSGKTRLAQAVVDDVAERWADGVVWIDLAPLTAGAPVAGAVAAGCGVTEVPGVELEALAVHRLARSELLLVLDNCEHVLPACAALADRVQGTAPGVTLLATSREPLRVSGEITWRIPSLELPPEAETDPEKVAGYDAVRLFLARAREARPDLVLDAAAVLTLASVCRRLDGIPLALELAAARLRSLTLSRLVDGLDDRFRLLTRGTRTAMSRQRTLRGSVEWSHELLSDDEQVLFRRLGVFAAPFTLEAAEAVAADDEIDRLEILDLLGRLVEKSLVQSTGDRYRLLETLRQFALERADAAGELAALRARHLEWFRRRVSHWRLDRAIASGEIVAEVAGEAPDLLAALESAAGAGGPVPAELLYSLVALWRPRYASAEVRSAWSKVSNTLAPGSDDWLAALAPLAVDLALGAELGWIPAARAALDERGKRLDPLTRGFVELGASFGLAYAGFATGIDGLRRALEDGRSGGSLALEVEAATHLATVFMGIGDCARSRPLLAWLDRHLPPDTRLRTPHRVNTGMLALFGGDFETARRLLVPDLDRFWDAISVTTAAVLGFYMSDAALIERASDVGERLRPPTALGGDSAWMRAMRLRVCGDLAGAAREGQAALDQGVLPIVSAMLQFSLAENRYTSGDDEGASKSLELLEAQVAATELHYTKIQVILLRAHLLRRRRESVAAERRTHDALALARDYELKLPTVEGLEALALLEADGGREPEAARLLGAAHSFRQSTGFCMRLFDRAGEIDALRSRLAPAHLEEGSRLPLAEAVDYARRGRGERGRPPTGWESLTPSESRVAELIAQGLPNREIAKALFVSVSTVKTHLLHVYAKLEVRSRSDLAAKVVRRGA